MQHSPQLQALLVLINKNIAKKGVPRKFLGSKFNNYFFMVGGYYYTVDLITGFVEETA